MAEDNKTFGLRKDPIIVSVVLAGLEDVVGVPKPSLTLNVLGFLIETDPAEGVFDDVLVSST